MKLQVETCVSAFDVHGSAALLRFATLVFDMSSLYLFETAWREPKGMCSSFNVLCFDE